MYKKQQNYPENVIVTVRMERLNLEADIRLATDSAFQDWLPELTSVLNQYRNTYLNPGRLTVTFHGKRLQPYDTLASLGAWDGSILQLEER